MNDPIRFINRPMHEVVSEQLGPYPDAQVPNSGSHDPAWMFGSKPEDWDYKNHIEVRDLRAERGDPAPARQLTADEYAAMTPRERQQARADGSADHVRGIN